MIWCVQRFQSRSHSQPGPEVPLTQSLSDWFTLQNYARESKALSEGYRLNVNGATDNRTFHLYGYVLAVNSAKTVKSLTLPKSVNAVVLSLTLSQ
jgi:hypothetical protein